MKPHIPLILLSALLATAPVKANLDYMETIPGHPAFIPDYDYFIVEENPSPLTPYFYKVARFDYNQTRYILSPDYLAMGFFKKDDNDLILGPLSLTSLAGSIILRQVVLAGTSLITPEDGKDDAGWGLPQVAIDGVGFSSGNINVTSNYCTIRNWSCASEDPLNFLLGNTGASFQNGSTKGNVTIAANKSVEVDTLTISDGRLLVHGDNSSQQSVSNNWLVELNNINASGGVTVDAGSNSGRVNVGNLTTGTSYASSYLVAGEVNLYGEINCDKLYIHAGKSVTLDAYVLHCNRLEISPTDENLPDITFNGSIDALESAYLTGKNIYGTSVNALFGSEECNFTATELVDIQGSIKAINLSFAANKVNLGNSVSTSTLSAKVSNSITFTGNVDIVTKLEIAPIDKTLPDITFSGFLSAENAEVTLSGRNIKGTSETAVLSAQKWNITADELVDFKGELQGDSYTINAKNVNLSGNVSGRMIAITATKEVSLAGNMGIGERLEVYAPNIALEGALAAQDVIFLQGQDIRGSNANAVYSSSTYRIDATGEVNIQGTFQGGILTVDAGGAINLGAVGSLENPVNSATITSESGKPVTVESFIGDSLTVKASGAITLESIGSLEKPVVNAVITGTSDAPVTVESFHGGENGTLGIDSQGVITIGKQPEQNSVTSAIPVYEGNVTINYRGEGTGAENWDVAMLGVMQGSVTVNAEKGKVNAGVINGTGDITAKQISMASYTGSNLKLTASDVVTVRGDMNVTGTEEKSASITAGEEVVLNGKSDLAHTNITAPLVTVAQELILKDQSRVEGNVTSETGGTVTVENSAIIGKVGRMGDTAVTVNLTNANIGGAENFSRLEVQSASRITSDLVVNEGAELSFVLNLENLATPVLTIGGDLKVANPNSPAFTIHLTGSNLPVLEKYALITATNKAKAPEFWDSANVSLTGLSNDETTLFWEGGTLYFSLGGQELDVATWTGATNFQWNTQDVNWKQNDATYLYKDGVAVVFNDTGKAGEVLLNGTLTPRSVLVENSQGHDYTFAGEGELDGKTVLVKQGSGTLTVNTVNDYSGGTTINGGTLVIGNTKALGTGNVVLGNATLNLASLSLDNNITVTGQNAYLGNGTLAGTLNVKEDRKLTLLENTSVTNAIHLGDDVVLDMGGNKIDCSITLGGDVTLGNGEIAQDLTVAEHRYLILSGDLAGQGTIILGDSATLNLGGKTLSNKVELKGNVTVGNGWIAQDLTVAEGNKLSLGAGLGGSGTIFLSKGSVLDLSGHSLSNKVELKGNAYVFTGYLHGDVEVGENLKLTLLGSLLPGGGVVHLGNNATLDLNTHIFFNAVTVTGNATICNGILNDNILTVTGGSKLTMGDGNVEPSYIRSFILEDGASANLGGNTFTGPVSLNGDVAIGNGTLNADVSVGAGHKLTLCDGNLGGSYVIRLAELSQLDLGGQTLTKNVELGGNASIGNGSLDSNLTVGDGYTLTLSDDLRGQGTIILNEKSHLNTDSGEINPNILHNAVKVAGNATICGTFEGKISVAAGKKLEFQSGTTAAGGVLLGHGTTLDLGCNQIDSSITLAGDAAIGNGTVNADVTVGDSHKLTLTSDLGGTGTIILNEQSSLNTHGDEVTYVLSNAVEVAGNASIQGSFSGKITVNEGKKLVFNSGTTAAGGIDLANNAALDLGGNQTSTAINLAGSATIGNGAFNGDFAVASSNTLALCGNLSGSGNVTLRDNATINLNNHTLFKAVGLEGNNTIGNGSLNTNVTVKEGAQAHFSGETRITGAGAITVEEDTTTVKALDPATTGLLKELTVSKGLIAGTGRAASLADGLYIKSEAALLIESMTLTANNEIYVGDNTITLKDVTIKLSEDYFDREYPVDGVYYFKLQDLFHCDVEFNNVVFDASALELPTGFDPDVNGIGIDFGDDVFIGKTEATLLMGDHWSQTVSVDEQGQVIFTKLVDTPEPTTGVLSVLGLGLLAGLRRRR